MKLGFPAHGRRRLDEHRDQLLASLGPESFADLWREGEAMSLSEAASSAITTLKEMANSA